MTNHIDLNELINAIAETQNNVLLLDVPLVVLDALENKPTAPDAAPDTVDPEFVPEVELSEDEAALLDLFHHRINSLFLTVKPKPRNTPKDLANYRKDMAVNMATDSIYAQLGRTTVLGTTCYGDMTTGAPPGMQGQGYDTLKSPGFPELTDEQVARLLDEIKNFSYEDDEECDDEECEDVNDAIPTFKVLGFHMMAHCFSATGKSGLVLSAGINSQSEIGFHNTTRKELDDMLLTFEVIIQDWLKYSYTVLGCAFFEFVLESYIMLSLLRPYVPVEANGFNGSSIPWQDLEF